MSVMLCERWAATLTGSGVLRPNYGNPNGDPDGPRARFCKLELPMAQLKPTNRQDNALLLRIRRLMDVQSQFWFDCVSSDAVGDRTRLPEVKLFMDSMRMIGEPFVRGFEKIKEELSDLGLRVLEKSSAAEMLGESDPVFRHYSFARCAS
jgi:hypothetical protein